jgi:hypothetical protein
MSLFPLPYCCCCSIISHWPRLFFHRSFRCTSLTSLTVANVSKDAEVKHYLNLPGSMTLVIWGPDPRQGAVFYFWLGMCLSCAAAALLARFFQNVSFLPCLLTFWPCSTSRRCHANHPNAPFSCGHCGPQLPSVRRADGSPLDRYSSTLPAPVFTQAYLCLPLSPAFSERFQSEYERHVLSGERAPLVRAGGNNSNAATAAPGPPTSARPNMDA